MEASDYEFEDETRPAKVSSSFVISLIQGFLLCSSGWPQT
jgi:hypothetical protein